MIKLRKLITSIQNNLIRLSKWPKKVSVDITWWVWRSMANSWQDGNFWKCACSFLSVMINHHVIHTAYCRSPLKNVPISVSLVLLIDMKWKDSNCWHLNWLADWNKLEDTVVTADSVTAFSSAVGRILLYYKGLPPTHRQSEQKCVLASF